MFKDRLQLHLIAGKGGNGIVAWCREKFRPNGGPFGGNGGKGGSVIIEADESYYSLDHFSTQKSIHAENGESGKSGNCTGKDGRDTILKVPPGTIVKEKESGKILYDFTKHKEQFCVCLGGVGGKGNSYFQTSVNRAPTQFTYGKEGEEAFVELELKLIADVGLVGFPNAGKSTLLSLATAAKAKCGNYPFTTLHPNLGTLMNEERGDRLVIADIPGIIKDAHKNRGLGFKFLRHIERTRALLFILDGSGSEGRDPGEDLQILMSELSAYDPLLLKKPFFVALNKIDDPASKEIVAAFKEKYAYSPESLFEISALTGEGVSSLLEHVKQTLLM